MSGTPESPQMRVGLIGCGGIGMLRAAAVSRTPSNQLDAVSDADLDRARNVSSRYGGVVESDWRSLVRSDRLDAVIVSTPPHLHAEMCIEALECGKHVLCEKPLARTTEECERIIETAQRNGKFVGTGFNYRFYPSIQKARYLLDSGLIGELDHIRAYAGYSASAHNPSWVHDAEVMGGGALRDNGIHLIDLTCYFLGDVIEVKGFSSNRVWGFDGCEDNGFALLRSSEGKIASLHASWTEWRGYRQLIELYGTRGCIRTWCFPMLTQVVWSSVLGGKTRRKTFCFPMTFIREKLRSYRGLVIQSFIKELEAFAQASHGEPTELASGLDGLRAVEIASAPQEISASRHTQGRCVLADGANRQRRAAPLGQEA